MAQCIKCGIIFLQPPPDFHSIKNYYPDNYRPHDPSNVKVNPLRNVFMRSIRNYAFSKNIKGEKRYKNGIKNILGSIYNRLAYRSIPPYKHHGKLLDIGCGIGSYLSIVKDLGWKPFGIELNGNAAQYANNILGHQVKAGSFEDIEYPEHYFDVITMWHSLEHFINPKKIVSKSRSILKKGGLLLIGVPNYSSLDRKIFKDNWNGFEIPLHLYHFTPDSITQLIEHAGFSCIKITHTIRPSDMVKSLKNLLVDHYKIRLISFMDPFLFIISIPFAFIFSFLKQSSIITVYAKKA